MIHYQKPIILMRPGAPNDRLAERLGKLGMNVWKWPAFTILPPEEPERVKERLSDLTNFDMVLLASPSAVAASADPAYMQSFVQDGLFWHLLTYCAGVGGSLLIIGSAAGVVAMGLEKINFAWYFKKITLLAFIGYLSGILVILLEHLLIGL